MPGETTYNPAVGLESSVAMRSVIADVNWSGLSIGPVCSKFWNLHGMNLIGKGQISPTLPHPSFIEKIFFIKIVNYLFYCASGQFINIVSYS